MQQKKHVLPLRSDMKFIFKTLSALYLLYGLIVFFALMLVFLPFIVISTFIKGKTGTDITFTFLRMWAFTYSVFIFQPVIYSGRKKLDASKAYIYVSNHNSYLDSPAVVIATPNAFKPLGKIEMTKIPGFGIIYKRVVVLIDRSSKESRAESVEQLKSVLRKGTSILIFPEGTMNTDLNIPVKEFYDGAFRIAIDTQCPIAPFVLINPRKLFPRNNPLVFRPGLTKVIFADPVEVTGYTQDDLPVLKEKVHQIMEDLIITHQK
jgi:1-acyl-sn-glycerol-3-phosphate acyltransferase